MANTTLFSSITNRLRRADSCNEAGGVAYKFTPKHELAQMAATGCFNGTFYAQAQTQLDDLRKLINQIDDTEFLAKLAVYSRERAFMKDMPAALLLSLSRRDTELMHRVFDRVIDNGRVLRTLFQMVRSGQFGRSGLSSSLQRAFQRWLNEASVNKLLSASIGHDPSLRDVLRMARPKPKDDARRALFGWLTDKEVDKWAPATEKDLPTQVQALAAYRRADSAEAQALILGDRSRGSVGSESNSISAASERGQVERTGHAGLSVRWDLLADAARGPLVWKAIARQMGPQALRMNLNTLLRHEVFQNGSKGSPDSVMIDYVAERLADPDEIRRSRQFPYQYLAAYLNAHSEIPQKIRTALHKAAEIACGNIPELSGPVVIGVDTSGSMTCPATGWQGRGANSKVRCVDVAALFGAALLRRNPDSVVIPFDTRAHHARLDADDSILSIAKRLSSFGGGGTDCSVPLVEANKRYGDRRFAGVVLISDTESWVYRNRPWGYGHRGATGVLTEWQKFVENQMRLGGVDIPAPKLVCIDIQPYGTTQAPERDDILNIGGFSDAVFNVASGFLDNDANRFVAEVESIEL